MVSVQTIVISFESSNNPSESQVADIIQLVSGWTLRVSFLLEPPLFQYFSQVCNWPVIEALFALFEEQVKVFFRDAVIAS